MRANAVNVEKDGYMHLCDVEFSARMWEETVKEMQEILRKGPLEISVRDRVWYNERIIYCAARAAGLREALSILGRKK
jgi:hypothetical protein